MNYKLPKFRPARRATKRALPSHLILTGAIAVGALIGIVWSGVETPVADWLSADSANRIVGVARVIDGDTLDLQGKRVRLYGIDAPEGRQSCTRDGQSWRCGQQATSALSNFIAGRLVRCEQRDIDQYGRIVAVCYAGDDNLNAKMVHEGWAMAYYHYTWRYVSDEVSARLARRGIWAGEVQAPWEWRRKS